MIHIKLQHNESKISKALGITDARKVLIDDEIKSVMLNEKLDVFTKEIEQIAYAIPRLTQAECIYIGFHIGTIRAKMHALRQELEKTHSFTSEPRSLMA